MARAGVGGACNMLGKRASYIVALVVCLVLAICGCGSSKAAKDDGASQTKASEVPSSVTQRGQTLGIESVLNARELGGYPTEDGRSIRHGRLLRSGSLESISDHDVTRLRERFGLSAICDLRTSVEVEGSPDPAIDGVTNLDIHVMDESEVARRTRDVQEQLEEFDDPEDVAFARSMVSCGYVNDRAYIEILMSQTGKAGYRRLFDELLSLPEGKALLFHGTKGKDRTGIAAMLVLSTLGVSDQVIREDYLLSNEFLAMEIERGREELMDAGVEDEEFPACLTAMDYTDAQLFDNALEWLNDTYGSGRDYVTRELGVNQEQIAALRDKLLE